MARRLSEASDPGVVPPLARARPIERTAFVVLTTNRGLAGALNTNTLRSAADRIETAQSHAEVSVIVVGRKGEAALRRGVPMLAAFTEVPDRPRVVDILPIARLVIDGFESGEFDEVELIYPRFVNTLTQAPTAVRLLPVVLPEVQEDSRSTRDVIFEPAPSTVLNSLLPRFVETVLYRSILELTASEHSARMVAMRNATENASDLIESLRLVYNKERQRRITSEIIDISAGANALAEQ